MNTANTDYDYNRICSMELWKREVELKGKGKGKGKKHNYTKTDERKKQKRIWFWFWFSKTSLKQQLFLQLMILGLNRNCVTRSCLLVFGYYAFLEVESKPVLSISTRPI